MVRVINEAAIFRVRKIAQTEVLGWEVGFVAAIFRLRKDLRRLSAIGRSAFGGKSAATKTKS
jgi:hypothetical protein